MKLHLERHGPKFLTLHSPSHFLSVLVVYYIGRFLLVLVCILFFDEREKGGSNRKYMGQTLRRINTERDKQTT